MEHGAARFGNSNGGAPKGVEDVRYTLFQSAFLIWYLRTCICQVPNWLVAQRCIYLFIQLWICNHKLVYFSKDRD